MALVLFYFINLNLMAPIFYQCRLILHYCKSKPPLFERLMLTNGSPQSPLSRVDSILEICKTAHRFLRYAPEEFSTLWDWSPFFSLLGSGWLNQVELQWHTRQAISILLGCSNINRERMNKLFAEHVPNALETDVSYFKYVLFQLQTC